MITIYNNRKLYNIVQRMKLWSLGRMNVRLDANNSKVYPSHIQSPKDVYT